MTLITATVSAELLKLRRRPASWILLAILLVMTAVFGYLLTYVVITTVDVTPGMVLDEAVASLLPTRVVPTALNQVAGFGAPIILVLGVLAVGSEYTWGTMKTLATQRPSRTVLVTGKLAALGIATSLFVVATLFVSWLASLIVAMLESHSAALPPVGELVMGAGAGWLILATYGALGVLLAFVFRGTGLALGIGLVYALVVENLLLAVPLPDRLGNVIGKALITPNALALSRAFGDDALDAGVAGPRIVADPAEASLVLVAYTCMFVLVGLALFRRRPLD